MSRVMMRRLFAFLALVAIAPLDAQAATRAFPSLAKRPAESGDRLAPPSPVQSAPAASDPALVGTVAELAGKAMAADAAFAAELGKGRSAVTAAAGAAAVSEAWVAAQIAISATDAARYESVAALAGLDTLHVDHLAGTDSARVAADLAAIDPARARVLAMVDAQTDALDGLRASLTQP
jgi:hypothetical protein